MIDIHCHILPFLDDGPKSMEGALEMAQIAYDDGIRKIVATPHYIESWRVIPREKVMESVEEFNLILNEKDIDIEILTGHEVYFTWGIPSLIKNGEVSTLNNSQYFLMEFPLSDIPKHADEMIFELKLMGKIPILAHPERYKEVKENPNILIEYIDMGALCQVDSGSIIGQFGKDTMEVARSLIGNNMVHFVASDGHCAKVRTPRLKDSYKKVMDLFGEEKSQELFKLNPKRVIEGVEIDIEKPRRINKKNIVEKIFYTLKSNFEKIE